MNAPGEQWVVRKVDAGDDVRYAEGHLLGLSKEIVGVSVQPEAADRHDWDELFGDNLGCVQDIETERLCLRFGEDLEAELVFRICPRFNGFPQVSTVIVRIGARDLDRLVPDQRV